MRLYAISIITIQNIITLGIKGIKHIEIINVVKFIILKL